MILAKDRPASTSPQIGPSPWRGCGPLSGNRSDTIVPLMPRTVRGIPRSGGTLSGTLTVTVVNGIATFSDLSVDLAGDGYTLHVTSGSLIAADSPTFSVT
jgi:hypothetical protein